jgi:hypothetical protein
MGSFRSVLRAVPFAIAVGLLSVTPASAAPSQTSWTQSTANVTYCTGMFAAGRVNFCRYPFAAQSWLNYAEVRDSDLRSKVPGTNIYQDKYADMYIVGNMVNAVANTTTISNNFSSTYPNNYNDIRLYVSTCYSGIYSTVMPGNEIPHANYVGLMSFKSPLSVGC